MLHGLDPAFIPPFPGSIVKYLSPKSPFNRVYGEICPFLAWRDDRPVGRIAAIVNRLHNQRYGDRTGFFGFFDSEDNMALARRPFEKAAEVVRSGDSSRCAVPITPASTTNAVSWWKALNIRPVSAWCGTRPTIGC